MGNSKMLEPNMQHSDGRILGYDYENRVVSEFGKQYVSGGVTILHPSITKVRKLRRREIPSVFRRSIVGDFIIKIIGILQEK